MAGRVQPFDGVAFAVLTELPEGYPLPVVGVDGPVRGADVRFDHHVTGEPVNLDAIGEEVPMPGTVATTMLDGDAVISAAVVLLRAAGEHAAVKKAWPTLYEAAHYCDHLIPSGHHPEAERSGLGLHCWLKERGLAVSELLAWATDELEPGEGRVRAAPSAGTRGKVFRELTLAVVVGIRRGTLPCDFAYLERLEAMEEVVRGAIRLVEGRVTLLEPGRYVDPLAVYRVVDTDVAVLAAPLPNGRYRYSVGVHPHAYGRLDLRPILAELDKREPGWGGRANAGGSPLEVGSVILPEELVSALNRLLV